MILSDIPIGKEFLIKHAKTTWSWIFQVSILECSTNKKALKISKEIHPEGTWYLVEDFNEKFEFVDYIGDLNEQ